MRAHFGFLPVWLVSLSGLTVATPLWAAHGPSGDVERLMQLSLNDLIRTPIVTASRRSESRDETASHIVVVSQEQIRERRYRNLADLLEDMPGVDFQRGTKSSQYNQFVVQGYVGPNKLLVMLDGVRIGHPAGGNFPVAENLALHGARQVEFVYGPAAALYGADAVAGVINIITDAHGLPDGRQLELSAGRFGQQELRFSGRWSLPGELRLSAAGHLQSADRAPLDHFYPADFARVDARTTSGTLVRAANDREPYAGPIASHSLLVRADWGQDLSVAYLRHAFRSLTSTGDPPATALYDPGARWLTTSDTVYGKARYALSPRLEGELVLDYSRAEVDPRSRYVNIYNHFTDGYSYTYGERLGIEQNLRWRLGERHEMVAGVGWSRHSAIEAASLPAPYNTAAAPGAQGFVYPNTSLPMAVHHQRFENWSAYGQMQSRWSDRWSTTAGVRVDRHSIYGESVNPRVGAIWRLTDDNLLKLAYGKAFRAPSPEESLGSFGNFDGSRDASGRFVGTGFRIPNLDLQPEKARTLGLTWDWRPGPQWHLVANWYASRIDHLVVTQASANLSAIPGAILVNPETKGNAGHQRQRGLDLAAQWRFSLGESWRGELWGSASWIRGRLAEADAMEWDIPLVAEHKLKAGLTLRWRDRFSVTPKLVRTGDVTNGRKRPSSVLAQQCTTTPTMPTRCTTAGATVVNLHLGWHKLLDGHASLWLDIYNLFDRRHDAAHGSASRTFYDMPQQPRTWVATLEYRF